VFFAQHCPAELVYAYEPREHIREELDANIALNKLQKKIIVEPWAVSDKVETFTLRLLQRDHEVESRRLDDLHEKVAVIKIDVEGMETAVLDGAARLLRESRPFVFAEARTDPERDTLDACFAKYDYKATGRVFNATPTYEYVAV
jgi:FkbM family methyltransferase